MVIGRQKASYMGDLGGAPSAKAENGELWTFTVRAFDAPRPERTITVNYDGFAEDVKVGDELLVDGGMVRFEVVEKIGPDVKCQCTDPGLLLPRANLTFWRDGSLVRERNAMLPTISSKDWLHIDFGIAEGVDFIAISFVKSAEVINHLKSYIKARARDRHLCPSLKQLGLTLMTWSHYLEHMHTMGKARCTTFISRLNGTTDANDPDVNLDFISSLQQLCLAPEANAALAQLDLVTPSTFDNQYFVNLISGEGLLTSDQVLVTGDEHTHELVRLYADDQDIFFEEFRRSMIRM